jgi:ubiquinone/menaquinone biosynthesis C-methylase UbiE
LAHIEPPGRCLDIGCGNGEVSLALRVAGFEATGVDMNKRRIAHLNATHPEVEWKCERVEDLVRSQERFDVITMFHVFEHLSQPQQALAEVCKLANPGGLIVIEVPNVGGMEARLKGRSWHYYKVDHVGYFKPRHLVGAMTSCGLKLLDVRGYQHFSFPQNHAIKDAVKSALAALNFKDVICAIAVKPC